MAFIVEKSLERIQKQHFSLIAMSIDRLSANNTAYNNLIKDDEKTMLIRCCSHIIDNAGKNVDAPELNTLMTKVRLLVSKSHDVKTLFRKFDSG